MSPTITIAEPVSPSKELDFLGNLAFGRKQVSLCFRVWSKQYSQPELIKLAHAATGTSALHSSQISGLQRDTLRDPSPKCLVCIGLTNQSVARSQGVKGLPKGPNDPQKEDQCGRERKI